MAKYKNYLHELKKKFVKEQNGRCALCLKTVAELRRYPHQFKKISNAFMLDHCHVTGRYRGAICGSCNGALRALDMPHDWLKRAIAYTGVPLQFLETLTSIENKG